MKIFAILTLSLAALAAAQCADLEKFWQQNADSVWKSTPQQLGGKMQLPMKFTDKEQSIYFYDAPSRAKSKLIFFGFPVTSLQIQTQDKKTVAITAQIYTATKDGVITNRAFDIMRRQLFGRIQGVLAVGVTPEKERKWEDSTSISTQTWEGKNGKFILRWDLSRRPELMQFSMVAPGEKLAKNIENTVSKTVAEDANGKLTVDQQGYRYLSLPAGTSPKKGYALTPVMERILTFYGENLSAKAKDAFTKLDAAPLTMPEDILKCLDKQKGALDLSIVKIWEIHYFDSFDSTKRFISAYNNVAKKMKKNTLKADTFVTKTKNTETIHTGKVFIAAVAQVEVFKQLRMKDFRGFKRFTDNISEQIERETPVIWITPGAMRIITGYNTQTGELCFTEAAGPANERKLIKAEDAWTLTFNVFALRRR